MFLIILFLLLLIIVNSNIDDLWIESKNLKEWYHPLDLCILADNSVNPIEQVMSDCEIRLKATTSIYQSTSSSSSSSSSFTAFPPLRCRVGNSWPSKSGFCSSVDIPYSQRKNLRKALIGFDDPNQHPLKELFTKLSKNKGALILIGDSVMQQFVGAIACELEREGIWKDREMFKNTDEVYSVDMNNGGQPVPIKFLPIYHFVNGRFDRIANASMHALKKTVGEYINNHDSLMIVLNMGLHYVSNPVAHFSRQDYISQMTMALQYLHSISLTPNKKVKIIWRETSAQHFPTPTGYWPGQRYAKDMKLVCVPINDTSPDSDWRNTDIRNIIYSNKFDVKILPFYNVTVPLYEMHVNGHKQDCTHMCWTPMLYNMCFHFLKNIEI